ncbi:MAG: hypothetical protein AAF206_20910 [Bacteroidota bacterium]
MKRIILIILCMGTIAYGQQTSQFLEGVENHPSRRFELKAANVVDQYDQHDFSVLLMPQSSFLGFIGDNYKRIKIDFSSVEKSTEAARLYDIKGQSAVGRNTCDFDGTLNIRKVREYQTLHLGVDNMYADSGIVSQGVLIADYELNEAEEQKYSGTFEGVMVLWFYVDREGKLKIDNIESFSDSYKNNQFVGSWTQYNPAKTKICNWGEHRIPNSGDLDIGAGEFSVNPKYYELGWEEFDIRK